MGGSKFVRYLIVTVVATILGIAALNLILPIKAYLDFYMISLIIFIFFTSGIYILGRKASQNKSGNIFLYIIIINVFVKLVGAFAMVFLYVELKAPESRLFVVPFLFIYFAFTIFETYFLSLQAQETK